MKKWVSAVLAFLFNASILPWAFAAQIGVSQPHISQVCNGLAFFSSALAAKVAKKPKIALSKLTSEAKAAAARHKKSS